jgi:NAD(P)-dependent dehydrogenase (short-subunit alcohol dehydrogenase family)
MIDEFSLRGKTALVTGAGRGIGRAIALVLAEAGADVAVVSRTAAEVERTADDARQVGREALSLTADLTDRVQVNAMVEAVVARFGRIDILVNGGGHTVAKPLIPLEGASVRHPESTPITDEEWAAGFNSNLTAVFYTCQAVGPHMIRAGSGKVINIGSVMSLLVSPYYTVQGSSKAALDYFTRSLALEWARFTINVNLIAPGFFPTVMSTGSMSDEEALAQAGERDHSRTPLKRAGRLREIGLLALYLASPASDFMTGQVVCLDGGLTARHG